MAGKWPEISRKSAGNHEFSGGSRWSKWYFIYITGTHVGPEDDPTGEQN